ncbi:MAG: SUMF1/EgtB/PvdO family nonheme iron enzyme [Sedimentisphaerales bacterium]|nr:SUMF1/EgtB/PvdO family nonheme iron enzyme [Sedimentisphaerales bacterium]
MSNVSERRLSCLAALAWQMLVSVGFATEATGIDRSDRVGDGRPPAVIIPEMTHLRGGTFRRAADPDKDVPARDYVLRDFWIGKYEVTFGQFDRFCEETGYYKVRLSPDTVHPFRDFERLATFKATQGQAAAEGMDATDLPQGLLDNYPAIRVCWLDACAYCLWLSEKTGIDFRLPTQAEWEYACTAGGNEAPIAPAQADEVAWFGGNLASPSGYTQIRPVGGKKPNRLGLYDMLGNVWEWCLDGATGFDYPDAVTEWQRISGKHTPLDMTTRGSLYWEAVSPLFRGPASNAKALRGAAWCEPANRVTPTYRMFYGCSYAADRVGFRVVCTEDPNSARLKAPWDSTPNLTR